MCPKPVAKKYYDVVVIGAGHNGLVAALLLARRGLKVLVLEEKSQLGGACRTEYPFARAPQAPSSTGAYLLGLMPPELLSKLEISLPLCRRDPHYFLPTLDSRYLLFGSDEHALEAQFCRFFSTHDWNAYRRMSAELAAMRDDIAPTWLEAPLSIEETASRYVRRELREVFVRLCRGSVGEYLGRFEFQHELLPAMFAVTDGFSGLLAKPSTPGTGMNFLVHNMCRLPGSDGTWMRVQGGMGTVSRVLAEAFLQAGGEIQLGKRVEQIIVYQGQVACVQPADEESLRAGKVVVNADPFRMLEMLDRQALGDDFPPYRDTLEKLKTPGSTLKVNLCLKGRPEFRCLSADLGQWRGTVHLLSDTEHPLQMLEENFELATAGKLPKTPAIEWYFDETLRDPEGNFSSALFVPCMPYALSDAHWDAKENEYTEELLSLCEQFAPGTRDLVVDQFVLTPPGIERHFGISHGQIHHVANTFGFSDRVSYQTPVGGLYLASAACHPAGSVIGAAGYICANLID